MPALCLRCVLVVSGWLSVLCVAGLTGDEPEAATGCSVLQTKVSIPTRAQAQWVPNSLISWRHALEVSPSLFEGCSKVFVDVGANRGTHIRKLFEPTKYPESPYLSIFNDAFGPADERVGRPSNVTGICAFGFEANPRWAPRLQEVEAIYRSKGWRVHFFAPTAVSDHAGEISFNLNNDGAYSDVGASVTKWSDEVKTVTVPSYDLAEFLKEMNTYALPGYKLMKMDIEGSEYIVLPPILEQRLLCKSVLDRLTIEWHRNKPDFVVGPEAQSDARAIELQAVNETRCGSPDAATVVSNIDDESYLEDGQPLP